MAVDRRILAGLLLFLGATQVTVGLMIAAARHPGYSIANDTISALGGGPAALVFNTSVILFGLLVLGGAYFTRNVFQSLVVTILLALTGIGALGVAVFPVGGGVFPLGEGVFPSVPAAIHDLFALITFLFGGVSAIYVARFLGTPFLHLSIILGVIGLVALGLFTSGNYLGLGRGGMERMIVLPVLAWFIALGGYLMAGKAA